MTTAQITNEVLALPLYERIQLAQWIWESVNDATSEELDAYDEATFAEAERRDAEMDRGEVQGISHEEVMALLRAQLHCG